MDHLLGEHPELLEDSVMSVQQVPNKGKHQYLALPWKKISQSKEILKSLLVVGFGAGLPFCQRMRCRFVSGSTPIKPSRLRVKS